MLLPPRLLSRHALHPALDDERGSCHLLFDSFNSLPSHYQIVSNTLPKEGVLHGTGLQPASGILCAICIAQASTCHHEGKDQAASLCRCRSDTVLAVATFTPVATGPTDALERRSALFAASMHMLQLSIPEEQIVRRHLLRERDMYTHTQRA